MMTINSFMNYDSDKVLTGIANGTVKNLNLIIVEHRDLENGDIRSSIVRFAGTTEKELNEAFAETVKNTQAEEADETVSVIAATEEVMPRYIDDDDAESDDADAVMVELLEWVYNRNNYSVVDSEEISYDYESLEGAILVNWSWNTYVGYARNFESIEYCTDKAISTKDCLPVDDTNKLQRSCLISSLELATIASATELIARLESEIKNMSEWKQPINIEEAVRKLYEDAERYPSLYHLPANDLK